MIRLHVEFEWDKFNLPHLARYGFGIPDSVRFYFFPCARFAFDVQVQYLLEQCHLGIFFV